MIPVRTAANFLRAWMFRAPLPFKLTLSLTGRCNGRCGHCAVWKQASAQDLPLEAVQRIFGAYPHFTWIDLTGGEIFLREDLPAVVQTITERSPRLEFLHFPTNALCEGTFDRIREIRGLFRGRLVVSVSIDGDEPGNDKIRGVPGGFRKAVELLGRLLHEALPRTSVYAGMTLYAANANEVERTFAAIRDRIPGFHPGLFHFNFAHAAGFYRNREVFRPFAGDFSAVDFIHRGGGYSLFAILEKAYRRLYGSYRRTGRTPVPCRSGEVSVYIDSLGRLHPCAMWDGEGVGLGDFGFDLRSALYSPRFQTLLRGVRDARCTHCFTPCEAYQTILSSPVKTASRLFSS